MRQQGYLTDIPNIQEYISSYAERVEDDCPEDLVDDIVAQYTQSQEEEEGEEAELITPPPPITHEEALHSLHTLRRYEEENKDGNIDLLRILRSHEREISTRCFKSREQVTLDRWFLN
jgi:hypothetical protein